MPVDLIMLIMFVGIVGTINRYVKNTAIQLIGTGIAIAVFVPYFRARLLGRKMPWEKGRGKDDGKPDGNDAPRDGQ